VVGSPETLLQLTNPPSLSALVHDPEKWNPVFRKDHARTKITREHDSIQLKHALAAEVIE
jgi:hypothetical protein